MDDYQSLSHTRWECKYHVVLVPKCRRQVLYGQITKDLGKQLAELARQRESRIETGSFQPDHIHMVMVIPPKYAVSEVVGRMKGITASRLRKRYEWLKRPYWKENVVWSEGYFVSTIGIDEDKILKYVKWQGRQDSGQAKLEL